MEFTRNRCSLRHLPIGFLLLACAGAILQADEHEHARLSERHAMRSEHFIMHTDLPHVEASRVLERMEETLRSVSSYWKREPHNLMEAYVVHDLASWPDAELPHPMARMIIERIGGAAFSGETGIGDSSSTALTIIASSSPGVAEHEVVHAYCGQAFGTTGPMWYREGMAQLLTYNLDTSMDIRCPPSTLEKLKAGPRRTISEVTQLGASARQLFESLKTRAYGDDEVLGFDPHAQWTAGDARSLEQVKESYAWSWLLCHLLQHNPNYRTRFKSLGHDYLTRREDTFGLLFGPVAGQLEFEYRFLQAHLEEGFRVDLCSWDWDKRFRGLENGRKVSIRIQAARGYQPSGLEIISGKKYLYSATGTWRIDQEHGQCDADGDDRGKGRLEAVVMSGSELGEPFVLGSRGHFRAPRDGRLYLRCGDDWNGLGDNEGSVVVTFSRPRRR